MARHRAQLTRTGLLARYAKVHGMSVIAAAGLHGTTDIEHLRHIVETFEDHGSQPFPQRRSFARSLPTTTLQGQTR